MFRTLAVCTSILFCATTGCAPTRPSGEPLNVLLITLDTTRADALSCYGGRAGLTPHLDRLAREGVLFTHARTVAPLTLPAHASMLTGLYPPRHTLHDNGLHRLPDGARTLAEMARERGIQTCAVVASNVLDRTFGLDQGFDVYEQPNMNRVAGDGAADELRAPVVANRAQRWLRRRDPSQPFFVWVHLHDAHVPYAPPSSYLERAGGNPYLGEVAAVDDGVGLVLGALEADGTLDRTIVIVVGDHGESLGEHGEPTHGALCFEGTLRVPLIVRTPESSRAGERSNSIVSVVDVFPTIARALGLEVPPGSDGVDLLSDDLEARRGVYCESLAGWFHYGWSPLVGWVDRDAKYLLSSRPALFDPERDAGESRDLLADASVHVERYRSGIARVLGAPRLDEAPEQRLDASLLASLRALGYGSTGRSAPAMPDPFAPTDAPSPLDATHELAPLMRALSMGDRGEVEPAVALLETIVAHNPDHWLAIDNLALGWMGLERFDEAHELLNRRTREGPRRTDTLINLALCCERLGRPEDALAASERALEIDPDQPQALALEADLLERLGRVEEARAVRARLAPMAHR